jgi:predicted TIM-barrel fold metal-dependent hydrolase
MSRQQKLQLLKDKATIIDCHTHIGVSPKMFLNLEYPYCLSLEDLVIRLKYLGISHAIAFPRGSSFYMIKDMSLREKLYPDCSAFPYEKENLLLLKEVYEVFPEYAEMIIPFFYFDPSRYVEEQVNHLEELITKYPVFGLKTCTSYINSYVSDLEKVGKPILDFAVKHELPLILHSSYSKADPWAQSADIISLAENNPTIRFCLAHSARFTQDILDKAASLPNCFVDVSALVIHCRLACENSNEIPPVTERFTADYTDPAAVLAALAKSYPDTIMWGTDSPCYYYIAEYLDKDGNTVKHNLKCDFDAEIKVLKSLPGELIEKIARDNILNFLGSCN